MRMPTVEQANEKRILHSIRAYLEGERNCTAKWLHGVIASDAPLANHLLLTRFSQCANLPRYRELQATPVFPIYPITCEHCGIRYEVRYRFSFGTNWGSAFFQCVDCGTNYPIPGEKVNARRLNEATGQWETIG
jgi:hypothetical protein